jgi:hypothetical protein
MANMKDADLLHIIQTAVADTTAFDDTFMGENEDLLDRYLGNPYGDEKAEQSKVISNDVMDVVEADMPALARIFLGSGDVIKFKPNKSSNDADVKEADQKTKYVNWQIREQPWSFPVLHGWIKNAEIQKTGVVKYFVEETTEVEEHRKEGYNAAELALFEESLEGEDVKSIEITERTEENEQGRFDVVFKVEKRRQEVKIKNIPLERFMITRNSESKDDAAVVGDIEETTRGELLARGFPRDLISQIPEAGNQSETAGGTTGNSSGVATTGSRLEDIRDADEGGADNELTFSDWALEKVELEDLYLMVDFDQDGIAERRHILRSNDIILENEVFNHVPYAIMSSILMPHKAIGRSRAEITAPTARTKTAVLRGMMDNIYGVNNPRIAVNENVHMDDMLVLRPNGVVRNKGEANPGQNMFPIEIPYIGDKSLQVIQYLDQTRAQSTGTLMASQGLNTDSLGKETATRFEGIRSEGGEKVELVARVIAETGFRDLYQGVAWLDANFQDTETEIEILGEELIVNPAEWKLTHSIVSNVGLGVGDDEKLLTTMSGFLQISQQLKANGSPLTDEVKIYNMLNRVVKGSDLPDTSEFFNNPERPDELIQAENEILNNIVQQQQQQLEASANPLAEAETIKAQAKLVEAKGKRELDIGQMLEDQRQFNIKAAQQQEEMALKQQESTREIALKLTELEQKFNRELSAENNANVITQV